MLPPEDHDRLVAWISHLPQMISTALASAWWRNLAKRLRCCRPVARLTGDDSDFLRARIRSGATLRSATGDLEDALFRWSSGWRHIRENLATRQLAEEFEQAHGLKKSPGKTSEHRREIFHLECGRYE